MRCHQTSGRCGGLAKGLGKEVYLWRQVDDPLLYLERRKYLCALQDAIFGVEGARIVLAKALQRIKDEGADRAA